MADIFDDLDGPADAQARPSKFAPKNSKFKPKPKVEQSPSDSQQLESSDFASPVKKELDIKPPVTAGIASDAANKLEDDAFKMEFDARTEGEEPNGDAMSVDGEEDRVVREIDVYFTPQSDPNSRLYFLQYPLRPTWRPYELDDLCEEVRVKPDTGEIEVDLTLDVDSKNFDPDARGTVSKQTLSCTWIPSSQTCYAVGVLLGNKLHLNPIHTLVQLRPSLQHFMSGGPRRGSTTGNQMEPIVPEEPVEEKSTGPSKKKNKASFETNQQNKDASKSWVPLKYHGSRSDLSAQYLQEMVTTQEGFDIPSFMSPCDYLNSMCPGTSYEEANTKGPYRRFLMSLPLEERFRTWLVEAQPVHRFDALKYLADDESDEDILCVLQKIAQLVQGLWVPKSSVLYGRDQGLDVLARDYILLMFSKSPIINSAHLPQQPQLAKAMKDVLKNLAVERGSFRDWKFKVPRDVSFIKLHPGILKEQEAAWERLEKPIMDHVFGGKNRPNTKNPTKTSLADKAKTPKSSSKDSVRTSTGPATRISLMSDETREALPRALQKVFQAHKVSSFQHICQRLREMALSESSRPKGVSREMIAAANGVDTPDELRIILNQIATNIHGVYVLKSSPDDPKNDALRKVVIDLLIAEGPNAKLKKAAIFEAAKLQLKREIQPNEYTKVMNELCVSQGSAWVLKSGDGNPR